MIKDTDISQLVIAIASALSQVGYNPAVEMSAEAAELSETATNELASLIAAAIVTDENTAAVALLDLQTNGYAEIDLDEGNVTLTVEQCKCRVKYLTNADAGGTSVVTMPTAGDAVQPLVQIFIVAGLAGDVSLVMQTSTTYSPATLTTGKTSYQILVKPGTILLPIASS